MRLIFTIILLMTLPFVTACGGGECAATSDLLEDEDSDCVEDTADNCLNLYNPDQFDGDEDGVGAACDEDDSDSSVAKSLHFTIPTILFKLIDSV